MDNTSRAYAAIYHHAHSLAAQGKKEESLDICWKLRLKPDLSLYRRAHVNLLIASIVDVGTYPDAAKYAQECIDLVAEVKAQGFTDDSEYLDNLVKVAEKEKTKIEIKLKAAKPKKRESDDLGDLLQLDGLEDRIVKTLETKFGGPSSTSDQATLYGPTKIEGMYITKTGMEKSQPATATAVVEQGMKDLEIEHQEKAKHTYITPPGTV